MLTPANFLFTQWKRLLSLIIHKREEDGITEEELVTMVDQAENEGGLDEHESELIRNAIEFHDLEVSEILTPRVDIVAAEENSTMEEVGSLFAESGYSRLPIYQDSIDNIVGVIHEKDFYAARYRGETMISALKAPVLYTTGNTKISELMRILQRNKAHMAVVVDEYGGTEGIATLEDIVEELVGDIWDEHDEVIEEFKKQEDGSYLIACSADLDDMFDLFAVKGACAATTVSGWVMEQVGRTTSRPRAWMSSLPGWSTAGSSRSRCGYCPRRSPRLNKEHCPCLRLRGRGLFAPGPLRLGEKRGIIALI